MNKEDITLYYWPCRFRGNIIRLIFSEAGVPYNDVHDFAEVERYVFQDNSKPTPTVAPPVLKIGDFILCQSSAIAQYLAQKYHLNPESLEQQAEALMLFNHCNDFLYEITRGHGYYDLWTAERWEEFKPTTYSQYLKLFQDLLKKNENGQHFFYGKSISYVDFAVFTVLDGLVYDFKQDTIIKQFPTLWAYYERMSNRPSVRDLVQTQKNNKWPFCGGEIQKNMESVMLK